ncbi:MAG TPA: LPS assembly lipoprotein LptE [Pseudolabrys sp.]|jgi:LPS-assembly lipoprotein|nr:LPS assembly lipoprotein LptE [Pseudolabrys sp.]
MWSLKARALTRLPAVLALAGLTAGCFQPLYGDSRVVPTAGLDNKLSSVDVRPIDTPNGTPLARIGVNVRNDLIYDLTGGGGTVSPTHRLDIHLTSSASQVIVNINTGRTDVQDLGINATYTLVDLATGKTVVSGQTFSRVSYNIPGEQQRFVGDRGRRDAENRAAQVIADNIKQRLASYFVAGT